MKLVAVLLHLLIFVACGSKPGEKDVREKGSSKFRIVDVNLNATKDVTPKNSFPNFIKEYQISAVVINTSTGFPVPLARFQIDMDPGQPVQVATSNMAGQIFWTERVNYNLTNEKKRILIKRRISQARTDDGQEVKFTLYPYASHLAENIAEFTNGLNEDLTQTTDKATAKMGDFRNTKIELKGGTIKFDYLSPTVHGSQYRITMRSHLNAVIKKANGEFVEYQLIDGDFNVFLDLKDKRGNVVYDKVLPKVTIRDGNFTFIFEDYILFSKKLSDLKLNIRIMPISNSDRLLPFYGRINIGKLSRLNGAHDLQFLDEYNSRYTDFKFKRIKRRKTTLGDNPQLDFSKVTAVFSGMGAGETATRRTVVYNATTCVSDFYDGENFTGELFEIIRDDGHKIIEEAKSGGCLTFTDTVFHHYYRPERFFIKKVKIKHIETGITETLRYMLNPWTILTLEIRDGVDDKELEKEIAAREREARQSKLILDNYYFETLSFTYEMDNYMTLFVRKNVLFDVEFWTLRYSSFALGMNAMEMIRDGVYLLKVAVQKGYEDIRKTLVEVEQTDHSTKIKKSLTKKPRDYIYIVKKLVKVKRGMIKTPIEWAVADLRLMTVRSNVVVQLEAVDQELLDLDADFTEQDIVTSAVEKVIEKKFPNEEPSLELFVDHEAGLPTRAFVGPMILLQLEGSSGVIPTDAIEKCRTTDCNFLERYNPNVHKRKYSHNRKYYGSQEHLQDKLVDDLYEEKKILDLKQDNQLKVESLLSTYLDMFDLKYVSDQNEPLEILPKEKFDCDSHDISDCFQETMSYNIPQDEFLAKFDGGWRVRYNAPTSLSDLFTKDGKELENLKKSLCHNSFEKLNFWAKKERLRFRGMRRQTEQNKIYNAFNQACGEEEPFTFTPILRTGDVESFLYLGGKTINFDLGSEASNDYMEYFDTNMSADLRASVNAEFKPLGFFTRAAALNDVMGIGVGVSAGIGTEGASGTEYSYGETSVLSSSTYLAMQKATFDISFTKPTLCLEIKMRPQFLAKLLAITVENEYYGVKLDEFLKGYFVCDYANSDQVAKVPFREKYYYFAQHFTEGHMLDDAAMENHPWLLALRGERDYVSFVQLLGIKPTTEQRNYGKFTQVYKFMTEAYLDNQEKLDASFTQNNIEELPLQTISQAYDNVLPSFPGMYVIRPEKKEYPYD